MPGIVVFKRRWSVGSDDLVVPGIFLAALHLIWIVILGVILGAVTFDPSSRCVATLRMHVLGYIVIMSLCVLVETCIACLSMRGTILDATPRRGMQYLLYVRLGVFVVEIIWLITGVVWIVQNYAACEAAAPKKALLGVVICNWVILLSVIISLWCTFDAAGRSWVKLKRYQESMKEREGRPGHKRRSGSRRRNWRHSFLITSLPYRKALRKYEQSWDKRCRLLFCCVKEDRNRSSFTEVARLFTEFFRDLDVVPSDIVAGLVLLRKEQKQRRRCIVQQQTNEVYQFLSGVPISPATRFLSLKNQEELSEFKRIIHFMHYALAAYGWPMYMMTHAGTGLCRIMPSLRCCCCCCCRRSTSRAHLVEDNCCSCNLAALNKLIGFEPGTFDIVYCTYHVDIGETPFFVAVDHEQEKVVISIRGTLSLQDVLTDLKAEPEPIPIEPIKEDWLGHKGMVQAAVYIKKKIKEDMLLSEAFNFDLERSTQDYELTIVGHSLGAGTAAILAILLQQEYPRLHCYAFSPPGGLISAPCVEQTKSFITSVVVGKDVVPRIGLYQLETLRQDLINVIKKSNHQKWKIISGSMMCCCAERPPEVDDEEAEVVGMYEQGRVERQTRYFQHPTDSEIALTSHAPLYPPGNIIHVVRNHPDNSRLCTSADPIYQAVWASNIDFSEVLISPTMINDHMPDNVLDALNKVLTNARPAKPSRKFTEAERQAMMSRDRPPSCVSIENIIPEQRMYLETSFPSSNDTLLDNTDHPCLAYCIPTETAQNGVQTLSWDFEPGNTSYRIHNDVRPGRPKSFPPKPRINMRLDLQYSLDCGQNAPLATPETLSEASSLTSVNSRGSWLGAQYHRLSSEVSTLEPIMQSPVRHRANGYSAFQAVNTSPSKAVRPLSTQLEDATQLSDSRSDKSSRHVANEESDLASVNGRRRITSVNSSGSADSPYVRHSPDSTDQCIYDAFAGCYSPAGRGYPHGLHLNKGYPHNVVVHNTSQPTSPQRSPTVPDASANNVIGAVTHLTWNGDVSDGCLQEKDANERGNKDAYDCRCGETFIAEDRGHSPRQQGAVQRGNRPCTCGCKHVVQRQVHGQMNLPQDADNLGDLNTDDKKAIRDSLRGHDDVIMCMDVTTNSDGVTNNDATICIDVKEHDVAMPGGVTQDDANANDDATIRDDVSCSDSEPFMTQHCDSDSQSTSPLYSLLHSGLFVQESQV